MTHQHTHARTHTHDASPSRAKAQGEIIKIVLEALYPRFIVPKGFQNPLEIAPSLMVFEMINIFSSCQKATKQLALRLYPYIPTYQIYRST